jgi:hypothetical protein
MVAEDRSIKVRVMLIEELIESAHCVFVGLVTCDRRDRDLMAFSLRPCLAGVIWLDDNINLNSDYNSQTPTQIFVI